MKIQKLKKNTTLVIISSVLIILFSPYVSSLLDFRNNSISSISGNDNLNVEVLFDFSDFDNENLGEIVDEITGYKIRILKVEQVGCQLTSVEIRSGISFRDDSLVKVREDNKIEFIIKRESSEFTSQQIEIFTRYDIEIYKELYSTSNLIYIPLNFNGKFIDGILDELMDVPGIRYIEPNFLLELDYTPNDYYYESRQWDMQLIGMENSWDFQAGSSNVRVAVIDTGIDYTHPDLSANYLPIGYDWVNDDTDPMDDMSHGTMCAGIISAVINNSIGIAGMAQVSIFAEKVVDAATNRASSSDLRSGLIHATDQGADIISLSLGGYQPDSTMKEGIDYAISKGVMIVNSAGNGNTDSDHYPSVYPGVFTVSSTDWCDLKAWESNYGDWIDVAAPGVNIWSTVPGNMYTSVSGTSFACPHVAGLAALIKSHYPSYTSSQIEDLIKSKAVDLGEAGFDEYYGWGRISAANLFGPCPDIFNPSPENRATKGVNTNPTLSVKVSHPENYLMNVSFFDASDGSLIDAQTGVISGETASVSWLGLSEDQRYFWYVVAEDGTTSRRSATFSFTTNALPLIWGYSPNSLHDYNPTLCVRVTDSNDDLMDVSFYDASDDSLIRTISGVASDELALTTWSRLSESTTYNWYVVVDDGTASTTSPTWSFTTMAEFYPIADFILSTDNIYRGQSVKFTYTGTQGDGSLAYSWNFGDGSPISNGLNPTHQYLVDGTFEVRLRVQDADGDWSNEVVRVVTVKWNDEPVLSQPVEVTIIYGTTGNWITCSVTDTIYGERPMYAYYVDDFDIYKVHFYDWTPGSSLNIYADGLSLGEHVFTICFMDGYGLSDTITVKVTVIEMPPIDAPLTPGLIVVMLVGIVGLSAFLSWNIKRKKLKR